MKLFAAVCLSALLISVTAFVGHAAEIRAMWVPCWEITTPAACSKLVEVARMDGINTLFVQVRGRGNAFYRSHYEPRAEELAGQSPDFDPLGHIVREGHAAGLQVHAWVNAYVIWTDRKLPISPEHLANKHPEWMMRTTEGKDFKTLGVFAEGIYACPSNDEWQEFCKDIFVDIAKDYDVDGLHFDYIRYPSSRFCYCHTCLAKFEAEVNKQITDEQKRRLAADADRRLAYTRAFPDKWDDFRRAQITRTVYAVHDAVKKIKPSIIVSAAVFPDRSEAYNDRFQDWRLWAKDKKLDLLCPMSYTDRSPIFLGQIRNVVNSSSGVPVCAGIGAWHMGTGSCIQKIKNARALGTAGFCLFSSAITNKGTDDRYLKTLRDELYPAAPSVASAGSK